MNQPANKVRSFPDALDGTPGGELDQDNHIDDQIDEQQGDVEVANEEELTREQQLLDQNYHELVAECKKAVGDIKDLENDRKSVNDDIAAIRSTLLTKGVSKKALAAAIAVSKLRDDEMDGYDLAYKILREAIGRPINDKQKDLFDSDVDAA